MEGRNGTIVSRQFVNRTLTIRANPLTKMQNATIRGRQIYRRLTTRGPKKLDLSQRPNQAHNVAVGPKCPGGGLTPLLDRPDASLRFEVFKDGRGPTSLGPGTRIEAAIGDIRPACVKR